MLLKKRTRVGTPCGGSTGSCKGLSWPGPVDSICIDSRSKMRKGKPPETTSANKSWCGEIGSPTLASHLSPRLVGRTPSV